MPDPPLPADVVVRMRSDRTFALAAAVVLAGAFPDLVSWALSALGGGQGSLPRAKANGARTNGHGKMNGARSPVGAAQRDDALLDVMRANPGASLAALIHLSGRPRTSTVTSLRRLEEAGCVEHRGKGVYVAADLVHELDEPPARVEGPAWVQPLSARRRARHSAEGAVRDELTMA